MSIGQEIHTTPDGRTFLLGLYRSPQNLRSAIRSVYGSTIDPKDIPDWEHWPSQLKILDQNGYGACTYYSSTQGLMYARLQSGQPHAQLEPLFGYSIATGGWNIGTSILEAAQQISEQGQCEVGQIPARLASPRSFTAQARANAMRFRFEIDQKLESWADVLSEVGGRRRAAIVAVQVGRDYNNLDSDGCMGVNRGPGNHAILLAGGKKMRKDGRPCVKHAGSWSTSWGQNGFAWYHEDLWDAVGYPEAYTIKAVIEDPNDASNPPVVLQV